jgi:hypothetical protein
MSDQMAWGNSIGAAFLALSLSACGGATNDDIRSQRTACGNGDAASCQLLGLPTPAIVAPSTATATATAVATATPVAGTALEQPLVLQPEKITLGDCTTNVPFIFSGGKPPFTVFTSDNFKIPVSAAVPLGSNFYFTTTILALGDPNLSSGPAYPLATLTVVDSGSHTATTTLSFLVPHPKCPLNPVLTAEPSSATAHVTEVLAFQVTGGNGQYLPPTTSDNGIATIVSQKPAGELPASFNVQAVSAGTALITVTSGDDQKSNIRFTVLP